MPHNLPANDVIRLKHMKQAAEEAISFSANRGRIDLDANTMYRRAVVNCLQEIGEAANRVGPQTRQHIASIPWQQIVGMRNRLVHSYFSIQSDLVWEVIQNDLTPLIMAIETALL